MKELEESFWSRRRPPRHLRDKRREGQRFKDHSIEFFSIRPVFRRPGEAVEESRAKVQFVRTGEFGGFSGSGPVAKGRERNPARRRNLRARLCA